MKNRKNIKMICLDVNLDDIHLKGVTKSAAYTNHKIRYNKDYLDLILPKVQIPYNPRDTKNSHGQTFIKEFNLKFPGGNDSNGKHGEAFRKKLGEINKTLSGLVNIDLKDPFFENNISGILLSVKAKTKYGSEDFNVNVFDREGTYLKNIDLNSLRGHTISGKVRIEKVWSRNDGTSGGLDISFIQIRDYGVEPKSAGGDQ